MGLFSLAKLFGITIRESANDGSDFTNPDADYRRLFLGEDGQLHVKDSAGAVTDIGAGSGTDLNLGTSFPGGPSTNDLCFRTDRGILYYYDGTRWLSVQILEAFIPMQTALIPFSASGASAIFGPMWGGEYDIWALEFITNSAVLTTNNGTNFWTIALTREPSATSIASYTTAADAVNTNVGHRVTINALLGTSDTYLSINPTKTLSPGNLYLQPKMTYRLVG